MLAVVGVGHPGGDDVAESGSWTPRARPAYPFVILQIVGFVIFMIAALAELSRIPFDMPIAESELVMGYLTEYSGFRFLFFFLAEYANMFALAVIAATLFLGGYWVPGSRGRAQLVGPWSSSAKAALLIFAFIWFRWTFPRLREDQLQTLAWKWLIPAGPGQHHPDRGRSRCTCDRRPLTSVAGSRAWMPRACG